MSEDAGLLKGPMFETTSLSKKSKVDTFVTLPALLDGGFQIDITPALV